MHFTKITRTVNSIATSADHARVVTLCAATHESRHGMFAALLSTQLFPEPLSPVFRRGGALEMLNEDVTLVVAFMLMLGVIDVLLVRPFLHPKARYFALHACANTVCAVAAFPDVVRALVTQPFDCFNGPACTMVGNSAAAAIHLYHIAAFSLRREDIFHHVTFAGVLCGLAIPFKQVGGVTINLGVFFLTGLPGGIDYVLLVLVKQGVIDRMTEKRWYVAINVWLRGPSMAIYLFIGFQTWVKQTYTGPTVFLFIVSMLHFYNGQYYNQQAIEAHAVAVEREKVAAAAVKVKSGSG
jgi:hypothetical protein